jgi:hypothetical protein
MSDTTDSAVKNPGSTAGTTVTAGDLTAAGKVSSVGDGVVVFLPANTSYELRLAGPNYGGPVGKPVRGVIRVKARKIWTVPSGGNFISPIFGPPRIVQGRVRAIEPNRLVVQAGPLVHVDLPNDDIIYDLADGPITVGRLVNVTALPGATFELRG